ncbi:MAG: hypothetical protein JWO89_163 [Verrucomicrobiaceae bacterium]|nr:hypothetical protein [Verrucomicrobiaceae bacterium]MDB6116743.1 hypothetical protein [Verrucomicrobiaceae bacterium]
MTAAVHYLIRLGCLVAAFGILTSCSSVCTGPGGEVTKVKIYKLNAAHRFQPQTDRSIRFEQERLLYGAVTQAERINRNGQYYTVFWKANEMSQPVTVRFEYRQQKTGLKIHVKEEQVSEVKKKNVSYLQVAGPEYKDDGAVTAWRVTLLRGKEELAHADSFLWN